MRLSTPLLAAVAALALAGCDQMKGGGDSPVAATVNGDKITVEQIETELKNAGADPKDQAVQKLALQRIIARKLLSNYATAQGLDGTPEAKVMKAAAAETFGASLAQRDAISKAKAPTPEEVTAYVAAHPELFAQRTVYLVEQVVLEKAPDAALQAALKPVDAYPDVIKVLDANKVAYRRGRTQLDALQLPPQLNTTIRGLKPDQAFVLPTQPTIGIARVLQSAVQPVVGVQAEQVARQIMTNQRQGKAAEDRLATLLKENEARIKYGEGFAPAKPTS